MKAEVLCVNDFFNRDKSFRFERASSIVNKTSFDEVEARRKYFLGKFLEEENSIERLIGEVALYKLCKNDIIEIPPGFMLKFKK